MSWRHLLHIVGAVVAAVGASMLVPTVTSLVYGEWGVALQIAMAGVVTVAVGGTLWRIFDQPGELSTREGFAAVGLAWTAICIMGTLPYLFTGSIPSITNAVFETTAGFTTTGASVVPDPALLPHGIQMWRSFTQWFGGMGIIVLSVAILPLLGMGAVQLARAESPGPSPERLTPRFQETAKRLWLVYVVITSAEIVLLWIGDMTFFEAINHSFTTMSTGGFSTHAGSLGAFSPYSQWVVIAFMIIAGASFTLHVRAASSPRRYWESTEFRWYVLVIIGSAAILTFGLVRSDMGAPVRDTLFTAVSIMTTTGYATADFGQWLPDLEILLVALMFIGGMAGSTAGGMKVYRVEVLMEASRSDVMRLIRPRGVFPVRLGRQIVSPRIVEAVQTFFLLYVLAFAGGSLLLALIATVLDNPLDVVTTVSAVASSLGNVGPGLGHVGPAENYLAVPELGRWLLASLMIVGRLEILPIVILFTPAVWRR